jgi:hypothetical protein
MKGTKVKDWADDQQKKMNDDIIGGWSEAEEHHWTCFKTAFENTYTNLGEKVFADHSIQTLKMEKGDLDTYIATFSKLLEQAEHSNTDQGALNLFK